MGFCKEQNNSRWNSITQVTLEQNIFEAYKYAIIIQISYNQTLNKYLLRKQKSTDNILTKLNYSVIRFLEHES